MHPCESPSIILSSQGRDGARDTAHFKALDAINVGVGVCSKHFYSYLFSSRWKFMSKIAVRQL